MIIGQKTLKENFTQLLKSDTLPRCIILNGPKGSGKRTFAHWLVSQMNCIMIESDIKADDVRQVIEQSYTLTEKTVYIFPDFHKMSGAAQNALLKITEEPPNLAYFILTTDSVSTILNTILSRATVFSMDPYTERELRSYLEVKADGVLSESVVDIYLSVCENLGDIDLLLSQSVTEFWDYVNLVVDNVARVSGSNSFKIGAKLNLGSTEDKYDLKLFWRAFIALCLRHIKAEPKSDAMYAEGIRITSKYLRELTINGINKQMCFDNWLLDIREDWMPYADN